MMAFNSHFFDRMKNRSLEEFGFELEELDVPDVMDESKMIAEGKVTTLDQYF